MSEPRMQEFYDEHAISTKVGDARPYIRYDCGDPEGIVRSAWKHSPQFAARIANQASGIVIPRYPPPFMKLHSVPAEIRPDDKVITGTHWHYHGDSLEVVESFRFPSGKLLPKKWWHHPSEMEKHIVEVHGGCNVQTVHEKANRAKYVFPPGDDKAKRLDLHPQGLARFVNAPRVFFVLEACIKADAVLSAGEAVFSAASVTLWRAPELESFARTLRGKLVYIVPDADYRRNDQVIRQALLCRSTLRRYGVRAKIAAPPQAAYEKDNRLKGIDDFLAAGGTMNDLEVFERETRGGLAEWLSARGRYRNDAVVRAAETLRGLAEHANEKGEFHGSLKSTALAMGIGIRRAQRALPDLVEMEAVEIVYGSLDVKSRWYGKGLEWRQQPTFRIRPELRANTTFHSLGDE